MTLIGFFFCLPVLIPGVVGVWLLVRERADALSRMAAWFTLKPFLTTTIWFVASFSPLGIIPAILITASLVYFYGGLFFGQNRRPAAWVLLGLDCLRWGNSLLLSLLNLNYNANRRLEVESDNLENLLLVTGIAGLALPFVYALVALAAVRLSAPLPFAGTYEKPKRGLSLPDADEKPKRDHPTETLTLSEFLNQIEEDQAEKSKRK